MGILVLLLLLLLLLLGVSVAGGPRREEEFCFPHPTLLTIVLKKPMVK
jgi:hypothetical protein